MASYFFFGKVFKPGSQDDQRVTKGPGYHVEGGDPKEHKETVEITRLVQEGVKMDGVHHVNEIFKDAVKRVKG